MAIRKLILLFTMFPALSVWCIYNDAKQGRNLGYIEVRYTGGIQHVESDAVVKCVSPWKSVTQLERSQRGSWIVPGYEKRTVMEISVSSTGEKLPETGWEVSISPTLRRDWQPAKLPGDATELESDAFNRSRSLILRSPSDITNWLGDVRLLMCGLLRAAFLTLLPIISMLLVTTLFPRGARESSECHKDAPAIGGAGNRLNELGTAASALLYFVTVVGIALGIAEHQLLHVSLWPGLHDDGSYFTPIILNRAIGRGNTYDVTIFSALSTDKKVRHHGQLYPAIVSRMLSHPNYSSLLALFADLNFIGFLISAAALGTWFYRRTALPLPAVLAISVLASLSTVGVMLYLQGRPEHGIPVTLCAFLLLEAFFGDNFSSDVFNGIRIGTVAAISPLPGAIMGLSSVFALCCGRQDRNTFNSSVLRAIYAAVVWATLTSLSTDVALSQILTGSASFSTFYLAFNLKALSPMWLKFPFVPFIGLPFAVMLLVSASRARRAWGGTNCFLSRAILCCSGLGLAVVVLTNAILFAGFHYCFIGLYPIVVSYVITRLFPLRCEAEGGRPTIRPSPSSAALFLAVAVLIANSSGLAHMALLQREVPINGTTLETATQQLDDLAAGMATNEVILIDAYENARSAVVLDRPPWRFRTIPEGRLLEYEQEMGFFAKYFVVLQSGSEPYERKGFVLKSSTFNQIPIVFAGYEISRFTPGYDFAIYERLQLNDSADAGVRASVH